MRRDRVIALLVLLGFGAWTGVSAGAEEAAKDPKVNEKEVAALIEQLGAEDFETREAATKKLKALGEAAHPALNAALKNDPDPEVKVRLTVLLGKDTVATVTDQETGITVSLTNQGARLDASKDGRLLWQLALSGQPGQSLTVANGQVRIAPNGALVDLQTGKLLAVRQGLMIRRGVQLRVMPQVQVQEEQ
jgi:hypothetical protein